MIRHCRLLLLFLWVSLTLLVVAYKQQPPAVPTVIEVTRIVAQSVTIEVTRVVEVMQTVEVSVTVAATAMTDSSNVATNIADNPLIPTIPYDYNHTGTYTLTRNNDTGCTLLVLHEISSEPLNTIGFELLCHRGAPSYNLGHAEGNVLIGNHTAVWSSSSPFGECHLIFEFAETSVEVKQIGQSLDCGFGGFVYADGIYQLINDATPTLGCMWTNPCEND
jgi:hypothetical protein